jgi:hypothetical protein
VCKIGYGGERCETRLIGQSVQKMEEDGATSAGVVGGVILAIILLIIIILVVIYYRRRLRRLKDELAYVTYTTDPNPSPDRRHFDNPVYAYPGVPAGASGVSLNNTGTKHIYNDLGMKSNLAKAKLGDEDTETFIEKGACGGYSEEKCLKSKADLLYNPNIYHSIEDLKPSSSKKEPFYDEVKDRSSNGKTSGSNPTDVYDHLQYNRPTNDMKPQYHRMDDTLKKGQSISKDV